MLAADRAVHHGRARTVGDGPCRPDGHGAVDDRQAGGEALDITGGHADEVLDLERIADVHDVDGPHGFRRRADVHSDTPGVSGHELEQRSSDLAQPTTTTVADSVMLAADVPFPVRGSARLPLFWT